MRTVNLLIAALALASATAAAQAPTPVPQEPIKLRPWPAKIYPDFGVNVLFPPGSRLTDDMASIKPRDGTRRQLHVWIKRDDQREFRVIVRDYDQDPDAPTPDEVLKDLTKDGNIRSLQEHPRTSGREWELESLQYGTRIRTRLVAFPPRYIFLQSFAPASDAKDPDVDAFLHGIMIFP